MARREASKANTRRAPNRLIRVVTEGKSEQQYVERVRARLGRANGVRIEVIVSPGPDAPTVVETALQIKKALDRDREDDDPEDSVWCVLDVDQNIDLEAQLTRARTSGIKVALTNPCWELWLLWHFEDGAAEVSCPDVQRLVRSHVGEAKILPRHILDKILDRQNDACRRAEQNRKRLESEGMGPNANPSSNVDMLASDMHRKSTK